MIEHVIIPIESQHVVKWCQEDGPAFTTRSVESGLKHRRKLETMETMFRCLSGKDTKMQAATFLHVAGPEALEVYDSFTWDEDNDKARSTKSLKNLTSIATLERISCGNVTNSTPETSNKERVSINTLLT